MISEVKSILKRAGSNKKTGGILKKSGNMKEIRDSLEITRVHLQTSAEEKEQRVGLCFDDCLKSEGVVTSCTDMMFISVANAA